LSSPKKLKRPNLAISSFKKGKILKNTKRPNFFQKFVKQQVKKNLASFSQISPK